MNMTDDLEQSGAEGANHVQIKTAKFESNPSRNAIFNTVSSQ